MPLLFLRILQSILAFDFLDASSEAAVAAVAAVQFFFVAAFYAVY